MKQWRKKFIQENEFNVGLDAAILMNPETWVSSGHVHSFADPLIDCKDCKTRYRADKLIEEWAHNNGDDMIADGMSDDELIKFITKNNIPCPNCGKKNFTSIRKFNLMFKTFRGVTEDSKSEIFLRPETAQGIFVNFKNVMRTTRAKLPMGIAQIGKAFRNEITPGNFTFRTREFEQMELEFFCKPDTDLKWFDYWRTFCKNWLLDLGIEEENIRLRDHEKYVPHVIEPSLGADRMALAFLCNAYEEEKIAEDDTRTVLHLHPAIAPFKVAVLPLSKKLSSKALEIYRKLSKEFMCDYDETGSIGKRYRREDEIGTPYCITVDFDTLEDNMVTIRDRDTMEQVRLEMEKVSEWVNNKKDC